ncbi:MAG: hypothetical protein ABI369_02250 [Acetobacteraceae bacterium]
MLLSTLDFYLRALGGRLRLVAEFEGREPVTLAGFGTIKDSGRTRPASRASKAGRSRAAAG